MKALSVTTKTGDSGITGLANGERLSKAEPVFALIGDLDELNSWLGLVVAQLGTEFRADRRILLQTQQVLFDLGAICARSSKVSLSSVSPLPLERRTNKLQSAMAEGWHSRFVLPGGTLLGANLDIARTVCRRVERSAVAYSQQYRLPQVVLRYLNRLSDYLYVLRCFVNHAVEYQEKLYFSQRKQKR